MPKHKRSRRRSSSSDEGSLRRKIRRLERKLGDIYDSHRRGDEEHVSSRCSRSPSHRYSLERRSLSENGEFRQTDSGALPFSSRGASPTACSTPPIPMTENTDPVLGEDILELLGEEISSKQVWGPLLHTNIASRWAGIVKSGLSDDDRRKLMDKHPPPENCPLLQPPKINPEVATAIAESVERRDARLAGLQQQIGCALTALGRTLSSLLKEEGGGNKAYIENLSDAGRMLADIHHSESISRRELVAINLNKELRSTLTEASVDGWLFGERLAERVNSKKELDKSGLQLKPQKPTAPAIRRRPPLTSQHLNARSLSRPVPSQYEARRGRQRQQQIRTPHQQHQHRGRDRKRSSMKHH